MKTETKTCNGCGETFIGTAEDKECIECSECVNVYYALISLVRYRYGREEMVLSAKTDLEATRSFRRYYDGTDQKYADFRKSFHPIILRRYVKDGPRRDLINLE